MVVSAVKSYDAFGNVVSASGVWKSQFGYAGKFGYQSDPDTGLKLLGHRYYDSDTGRFLTRDPIKDGRNWYTYCGNNPVSFFDADGLSLNNNEIRAWIQGILNNIEIFDPTGIADIVNGVNFSVHGEWSVY